MPGSFHSPITMITFLAISLASLLLAQPLCKFLFPQSSQKRSIRQPSTMPNPYDLRSKGPPTNTQAIMFTAILRRPCLYLRKQRVNHFRNPFLRPFAHAGEHHFPDIYNEHGKDAVIVSGVQMRVLQFLTRHFG